MATQITPTSPKAWAPDQTAFVPGDIIPDALILSTATMVGSIEGDAPAVRVPYVLDDGEAGFVAEGDLIDDAGQQFDEVVVLTGKVSTLGKYSYETLQQPQAAQMVVESLSRSVTTKANTAYLGNGPGDDGPTGLLNVSGVTDCGAIVGNLDPLIEAVAGIEADGGTPTHILAGPDAWAALAKLKRATDSNESLVGAGTVAATRALLGLPVLVTNAMPAASLIVADKAAIIAAQSPIRVARSEDAYFSSDVVAVRVTWRLGWKVMRPARLAYLTTGPVVFIVTLGSPSAGTFTLTYRGKTTGTIAHNASAATVKSALVALDDGYGASDWTVTGSNGGPYTITTPGGALTGSGAGLTDGTFSIA